MAAESLEKGLAEDGREQTATHPSLLNFSLAAVAAEFRSGTAGFAYQS
jgi:hypothetical protein